MRGGSDGSGTARREATTEGVTARPDDTGRCRRWAFREEARTDTPDNAGGRDLLTSRHRSGGKTC